MNRASSRSHSVFTCVIESKVGVMVLFSKLIFKFSFSCPYSFFLNVFRLMFCFITCCQWESQGVTHHRFARLNLVDLAGSERYGHLLC